MGKLSPEHIAIILDIIEEGKGEDEEIDAALDELAHVVTDGVVNEDLLEFLESYLDTVDDDEEKRVQPVLAALRKLHQSS